jgi:hypothetical protein
MLPQNPGTPLTAPAEPGEEDVARVICASVVTDASGVYATMENIRDSALRHNPVQGIHTALLYQSGWFLHWAEGPVGPVTSLFERVRKDHRHNAQHVVHRSRGRRLLMNTWSMMLSPSTEGAEAFGERVMAIRARMHEGTQYPPTSVVRRLLMPMQLREALELPDPESYYRVVVCAAAGNAAFDLVNWLAERHDVPKASRRHAGELDLDSGSEYTDFMLGGYACRVIAAARSNLSQGLHRSLMPDWQVLLLVFSGDPRRDTALLERVRDAFKGLPATPELVTTVPTAKAYVPIQQAANACGLVCLNGGVIAGHDSQSLWAVVQDRLAQLGPPHTSDWATLNALGDE